MDWLVFHWTTRQRLRTGVVVLLLLAGFWPHAETFAQSRPDSLSGVEVRLHHRADVERVQLTPERGTLGVQLPSGGPPVLRITPADTITLGRRQSDIYAAHGDARLYADHLRLLSANNAAWTLRLPDESTRTYTGSLRLRPADTATTLQLVNRVSLSDYVSSVVSSEYGFNDTAGARAMAVVARTYALFSSKPSDGTYDHVDGIASQVYRGLDEVTSWARAAARVTEGQILTYEGSPIQAVYFSSSGGHTANNEDVWTGSAPIPYLRGIEDPYDAPSPKHEWTARVNRSALLQALTLHQNASVKGFLLGERTSSGRLRTIEVLRSDDTTTEIEASTFRSVVNRGVDGDPLMSTWFDARRDGSMYVFEGRGHGHGVGLNQWGAHAMAQRGKDYREILSFYYTGVQIQQLDGTTSLPPVAEEPPEPTRDTSTSRIGW